MQLADGEYTTLSFLEMLKEKYGKKLNGEEFTTNDLAQYLIRGYTPHRYGNIKISSSIEKGVRIIKVNEVEVKQVKKK